MHFPCVQGESKAKVSETCIFFNGPMGKFVKTLWSLQKSVDKCLLALTWVITVVFDKLSASVILGHTDLKKQNKKNPFNLPSYYPLAYVVLTPCFLLQTWL